MTKPRNSEENISKKSSHILNGVLVVLLLIAVRIWHVAIMQHDEKIEASKKPQRRNVVEKSDRATISDRFGMPLAMNRMQYNIAVSYGGIREVPRTLWKKNPEGKKYKIPMRKEYITSLSKYLGKELEMDSERIEDLIHSKAALFGNVPFILKENVSEETYYRLKMVEKEWPGLSAEKCAKRSYPQNLSCADVVGYLGAISKEEYLSITEEMSQLRNVLNASEEGQEYELPKGYKSLFDLSKRLKVLEGKAYTLNDLVGKSGIEKSYDEKLRGTSGLKAFVSDPRGHFLQDLPSHTATPGAHLALTISAELQEYAERLLTEYEQAPIPTALLKLWALFPDKQPWIKGGAIVVMDPKNGEILALASYPRFDPNDFVKGGKKERVHKWLESEEYVASLWNHEHSFTRERFDTVKGIFFEEELDLSWRNYLRLILPSTSKVLQVIEKKNTIGDAIFASAQMEALFSLFPGLAPVKVMDFIYEKSPGNHVQITLPERDFLQKRFEVVKGDVQTIRDALAPYFSSLMRNDDKLLLIDLYRIACDGTRVETSLQGILQKMEIGEFYKTSVALVGYKKELHKCVKEAFHEIDFKRWREENFKDYLAKKREQEELAKRKWGRPYLEYLDEAEKILFESFWKEHEWELILARFLNKPLSPTLAAYHEKIKKISLPNQLKEIASSFEASKIFPFLKMHRSFEELRRPLFGVYAGIRNENGAYLEKHLAAAFYPKQGFGYARSYAFRQSITVGSVFKLVPAYEAMRQRLSEAQEEGKALTDINPLTIIDDYGHEENPCVGYTLANKPIPRFYRGGRVPRTDHRGVGKIDVIGAIAASSNPYFALLAGDLLKDPEDLCKAASLLAYGDKTGIDLPGEIKGNIPLDVTYNRTGLYSLAMGQHSLVGTPLQTAVMLSAIANGGKILKPKILGSEGHIPVKSEVKRTIVLPKIIRQTLLKGLQQVIMGEKGTARMLQGMFPEQLLSRVVGKTSTAESVERMSFDGEKGKALCKHVAFNAICFAPGKEFENPELVVIVYLRYGEFGRIAAPYALKMIQKWEEIKAREQKKM